jgi:hypothetical protein
MVSLCWCMLWWLCWWLMGTRSASIVTITSRSEKIDLMKCLSYNNHEICMGQNLSDLKFSWWWVHAVVPSTGTGCVEDITWMFQNYVWLHARRLY